MDLERKKRNYRQHLLHGNEGKVPERTWRRWRQSKRPRESVDNKEKQKKTNATDKESNVDNPIAILPQINSDNETVECNVETTSELSINKDNITIRNNDVYQSENCQAAVTVSQDSTSIHNLDNSILDRFNLDDFSLDAFSEDELKDFVLINALKINHNLSFAEGQDICTLINLKTNSESNSINASKYHLFKIIDAFSSSVSVHHVCDKCEKYVGSHSKSEIASNVLLMCKHCEKEINVMSNMESGNFFLYISLSSQLQMLFSKYGDSILHSRTREKVCKYAIEDIYDGHGYKIRKDKEFISINFNFDGVPIFKSSTFSIHPILCSINDIAPEKRKNHILLCGIWFGKTKPNVNSYFIPFVEEAKHLYHHGFNYTYNNCNYVKKCIVLAGVCDSKARCEIRGTKQYNGKYGCGLCKHPGLRVAKGSGTCRIYPVDASNNPYGEDLRSHTEVLHLVNSDNTTNKGVKLKSILCDIPDFDIIENLPPDWMHCIALGVCRQFANMWFMTYFASELEIVDKLLLICKPTSEISRTPRKMSDRVHWKAHEWVAWLLYYSLPILKQTNIPLRNIQHWSLLVDGVSILLKTSIMKSEIVYAENCLLLFVKEIPDLYDKSYVSFNVHLLTHLSRSVLQWGPLWTHSAFIFENYNQQILRFIQSSQRVALQICNSFRLRSVVYYLYHFLEKKFSERENLFIRNMLFHSNLTNATAISSIDEIQTVGHSSLKVLTRDYFLAFQRINVQLPQNYCTYDKIMIGKELIYSAKYTKVKKRNNFTVLLNDGEIFEITTFIVLKIEDIDCCYAIGHYFSTIKNGFLIGKRLKYMNILGQKCKELVVIRAKTIKEKVIVVPCGENEQMVCLNLNKYEILL